VARESWRPEDCRRLTGAGRQAIALRPAPKIRMSRNYCFRIEPKLLKQAHIFGGPAARQCGLSEVGLELAIRDWRGALAPPPP